MLGVGPDASARELRAAYRRLVLAHHPDRAAPGERVEAEATTAALTVAYRVLADPSARARYDLDAGIPRRGRTGVRRADRPAGDPRPVARPTHDPVLRRPPRDHGVRRRAAPPPDTTPIAEALPRLVPAAAAVLGGVALLLAGSATRLPGLQVAGGMLAAVGIVAALLLELARKDGG